MTDPHPPELPYQLERAELGALAHDVAYEEIEVADAAVPDQHAGGVTLQTVRLTKVDLSGSRLEHLKLIDSRLSACSLANVQGRRANVTRVAIATSRLTGIHLPEATLRDVTIQGCRVDLASFGFSRLLRVTFDDCLLVQTDFLESQLESVRFRHCDLSRADFRGAALKLCELRGCNLTDLQGVKSLRGAALEWRDIVEMAGTWAAALGIEVLDTD